MCVAIAQFELTASVSAARKSPHAPSAPGCCRWKSTWHARVIASVQPANHRRKRLGPLCLCRKFLVFSARPLRSPARRCILVDSEPTSYADLLQLIDHIHAAGMQVELFTNGAALSDAMARFPAQNAGWPWFSSSTR